MKGPTKAKKNIERGPTKEKNEEKGPTKVKMKGIDPQNFFALQISKMYLRPTRALIRP
jgi:hypothetical protein